MKYLFIGRSQGILTQFFRYFFVGGSAAVVDLTVFALLNERYHYLIAAALAYAAGLLWNHVFCILWVFDRKQSLWSELRVVIPIAIGGLLWTEMLLSFFVEQLSWLPIVAKVAALWIVLIWNFSMRKVFVFR